MQKYGLNRHAVIKLALRRFLFPDEKTNIPLDGHTATVQDGSVTVKPSSDAEKPETVDDDPFGEPLAPQREEKGFDVDAFKTVMEKSVTDGFRPINEKLEGLEAKIQDFPNMVGLLGSHFKTLIGDYNLKMSAIANFLENHIEILERTSSAKRCDKDAKGLELLRTDFKGI